MGKGNQSFQKKGLGMTSQLSVMVYLIFLLWVIVLISIEWTLIIHVAYDEMK